jgi:hypothetical protein
MKFGEPVTNICAGDGNPLRHAYFVRRKGKNIECTDKKGRFWLTDAEVVYPGHLNREYCDVLWQPIWERRYGKATMEEKNDE